MNVNVNKDLISQEYFNLLEEIPEDVLTKIFFYSEVSSLNLSSTCLKNRKFFLEKLFLGGYQIACISLNLAKECTKSAKAVALYNLEKGLKLIESNDNASVKLSIAKFYAKINMDEALEMPTLKAA